MTDAQGKDRRPVAGETSRPIRGPPPPAAGPTVSSHFRAGCPPCARAWRTILSAPLVSSLASNPSAATAPRRDRNARHLGCSGVRAAAEAEGPAGSPARKRLFLRQPRPRGCRVPTSPVPAAMELTHWLLNDDRPEDCDRVAGCDRKRARARLSPPRWSYRWPALLAVSEQAIAGYADVTGETWKPYEASPAPVAAAVPRPPRGGGGAPGQRNAPRRSVGRGFGPAVVQHRQRVSSSAPSRVDHRLLSETADGTRCINTGCAATMAMRPKSSGSGRLRRTRFPNTSCPTDEGTGSTQAKSSLLRMDHLQRERTAGGDARIDTQCARRPGDATEIARRSEWKN
jgi:hypothetical protein